MRTRPFVWLLTVSLTLAGSQAAHVLTYRLAAPNADDRAHLLEETGHAYMAYLPLALALCSAAAVLALIGQARASRRGVAASPAAWQFAAIAPLVFCCQEHFERLQHDGSFPWDAVAQRTFVLGLALQLPFALAAYVAARVLLRAARAVARLLGHTRPARRVASVPPAYRRSVAVRRRPALALGFGTRGPPLLLAA